MADHPYFSTTHCDDCMQLHLKAKRRANPPVQGALFPREVGWRVTGAHTDGTPCYHKTNNCPEHGSCIDCDACKAECECN